MASTRVTFPAGEVSGTGAVLRAEPVPAEAGPSFASSPAAAVPGAAHGAFDHEVPGAEPSAALIAVVTDVTPFHPVDHSWPDQPADLGTLAGYPVVDCVTGAAEGGTGPLLLGGDVPVRRGDPAWEWYVVHVVDFGSALPPLPGDPVDLQVDGARRVALSAGHTACHLSALALNLEAARFWRKDPDRADCLGNPDLDQLAVTSSRVVEGGARDGYRFGKSLRKKGFEAAAFVAAAPEVQSAVDARLAAWVASGAPVRVVDDGDATLTARRYWTCELPDGPARVPCGGTHVASLASLGRVTVNYTVSEDGTGLDVATWVG